MLHWLCTATDHRICQNVVRNNRQRLECHFFVLTSSVIYYWTDLQQHGISLLNREVQEFCSTNYVLGTIFLSLAGHSFGLLSWWVFEILLINWPSINWNGCVNMTNGSAYCTLVRWLDTNGSRWCEMAKVIGKWLIVSRYGIVLHQRTHRKVKWFNVTPNGLTWRQMV